AEDDAGIDLFADNGFSETSVRQIAEKADVNVAMINYYFGSKKELLESIFEYQLANKTISLEKIMKNDKLNPVQKIETYLDYFIESAFSSLKFNKIMVKRTTTEVDQESRIFKLVVESRAQYRKIIEEVIVQGQKEKLFRKGIDIVLMSAIFVGTVNHVLSNVPYYSTVYNIPEGDMKAYKEKFVKKLNKEIKLIIKSYLSIDAKA
ncbi:MAG: TetR/AcrR family transcriptional regulator, partial [Sphingobacteriales bacterium]